MKEFMLCALAIPGFAFFHDWAPSIAQAVIAPIATVYMDPNAQSFLTWCVLMVQDLNLESRHVLVTDMKSNTVMSLNGKTIDADTKEGFALIVIPATRISLELYKRTWELLAPGGAIVVYHDNKVLMRMNKDLREAA